MTAAQIAIEADREIRTVTRVLLRLHKQKEVHITSWQTNPVGKKTARYRWGKGRDEPHPPVATYAEKAKQWRESDEGAERTRRYNKARYARQKFSQGGVAAIDPLLAAMLRPIR